LEVGKIRAEDDARRPAMALSQVYPSFFILTSVHLSFRHQPRDLPRTARFPFVWVSFVWAIGSSFLFLQE
jgi:hypothetical protein